MAMPVSFQPNSNATATLAATASSGRVAITLSGANQVEVTNKSAANWAYVEAGDATVTAAVPSGSAGGYPVGPGQSKIITVNTSITNMAAICDATLTATLFFTPGNGVS